MILRYHCALHQTTATVDPATRTVRLRWPPLGLTSRVEQCALCQVAHRALEDPEAPVGPHGPPHGHRGGARCEVIRDA